MTKRVTLSLLLLAGALLACSDSGHLLAPTSDSPNTQFAAVQVSPVSLELSTLAPWNTAVVTAKAVTRAGGTVPNSGLVVAYSSSAPATATVSDSGLITGLTPGDAVITVAMTLEDVTHTADVTVAVHEPGSWPAVGGVYDLTATITRSDPAWEIPNGTLQLALITIQHNGDSSQFTGTFEDFRAVDPDGTVTGSGNPPGTVIGTVQTDGHIVMELFNVGMQSSYWYGSGTFTGQGMSGNFGAGGHITGTFVANRR